MRQLEIPGTEGHPRVSLELRNGDEIEFKCGNRIRHGIVQGAQKDAECPYLVGYEVDEKDSDYDLSIEEIRSGWATYGMRVDEFVTLVYRPHPEHT